ncbi:lymphatic vessel endothelial hyaluronic acid receptor 1a [Melanotaenia boesemani]|uniref:lymphatic vessel endothelial hyaluronic acid receptor 1a n=1 Tax=Melanotaenia boesemani TaxID=1250792 RepID=UPI001C04A204|nr:lymphatic vessel endothelial hyaluronic acid receptor 1a [Melanotaenia boesemani]
MNGIQLCITSMFFITLVFSDPNMNHIRVFPAVDQSIAGVIQVSSLNSQNQLQYAFNASEARTLCQSLGLNIASKAQVEEALRRGLETCRFGWIDEHFAVIPRIHALANCGNNQIGLVSWRTPVTKKFDVFCFNESDSATQLKDTATDSPLSSRFHTNPPFKATDSILTTHLLASTSSSLPSSFSTPKIMTNEVEPAYLVGTAHSSLKARTVLISCTCSLLLISLATLAYLKMRRCSSLRGDLRQQQEYIYKETCVTNTEAKKTTQDDERVEMGGKEH